MVLGMGLNRAADEDQAVRHVYVTLCHRHESDTHRINFVCLRRNHFKASQCAFSHALQIARGDACIYVSGALLVREGAFG